MKTIDPKSIIIGVLGTLFIFSTLGLRPKTDELGHLVVRSLTTVSYTHLTLPTTPYV